VSLGQTITKEEAEQLLLTDLTAAALDTVRLCPVLAHSPIRWAAVADFTFNLGSGRLKASTLRRRINAGEYDDVPYELSRWVRGDGRVLPGLVARRNAEISLWKSADEHSAFTTGNLSGITGTTLSSAQFTGLANGSSGR